MAKIFYDNHADIEILKDKTICIVGYGSQGEAQAKNLKDSNLRVILGLREGGESYKRAVADGFEVYPIDGGCKKADYIQILIPDPKQPQVYQEFIHPNLKEGAILGFSHGFNIHFEQIKPPEFVDVVLVAPKGPGSLVRQTYKEGFGVPALVGVWQDKSKKALLYALAYAKAIGSTRAGVILTTFKEETETDLFGEQVVLCGGVTALIMTAFEVLVESGYQPQVAYFECLHELKLIVDLIQRYGIDGMRQRVSDTAEYGDLTRGRRVINQKAKENMKKILNEITSGEFAREWILEDKTGRVVYNRLKEKDKQHLIEKVGEELRKMFK